jgi:hypothetical protein
MGCIFNFELSLIDFFSSTEVGKSVLYIFCNNIFLKKVTLEKPYGVSGVVDGDTGNRSNERLTNLSVRSLFSISNFKFFRKMTLIKNKR